MPLIETATGSLFYADHRDATGHRPVTLILHGAGGTHLDWPAEIRRMPEANALALDLNGHGRSSGTGRATVGAYAADVLAFLDALRLPQVILAGHSMGGGIAQRLALDAPDRVQGLILLATAARLGVPPAFTAALTNDVPDALRQIVNTFYGPQGSDQARRLGLQRLSQVPVSVLRQDYAACNAFDVRGEVRRIQQPTLIIGGQADTITLFSESQYLHEQIATSTLEPIPDGGHMVMLEQPALVASRIQAWLLRTYGE
jgi:pimeloyl-ACP methyl ester carboxylesterase